MTPEKPNKFAIVQAKMKAARAEFDAKHPKLTPRRPALGWDPIIYFLSDRKIKPLGRLPNPDEENEDANDQSRELTNWLNMRDFYRASKSFRALNGRNSDDDQDGGATSDGPV
jgi:hypothetical protein